MECRKPVFQLTVFLELHSRKIVRNLEQIISSDKYPCIFSHKIEAIVSIIVQHTREKMLTNSSFYFYFIYIYIFFKD